MNKKFRALLHVLIVVLGASSVASAQSVVDPNFVEFVPSPDHNSVLSNGTPAVSRYDLEFYETGTMTPVQIVDLGKPAVASDGKIHVSFLPTWPSAGVIYSARVSAVGPGGATDSNQSNQFTFTGACNFVTNTSKLSFGASGGSGSVSVLANSGCVWNSSSSVNWVTVLNGSVSGAGSVSLSVAANTSTTARTASLNVAGEIVTIDQAAGAGTCPGVAGTSKVSLPSMATTGSIAVSAANSCAWQATSSASWLTVSPASGSGTSAVSYSAAANTASTSRSATMQIASTLVTVTQSAYGVTTTSCMPTFTPASLSLDAAGGSVAMNSTSNCDWIPTTTVSWVSFVRSGNLLTVAVLPNTGAAARSATINAGGTTIAVSQKGLALCPGVAAVSTLSLAATAGTGTVAVNAAASCAWTAKSSASWLTVTPVSGTGASSASYSAAANTTTLPRTATLTIASTVVAVTQAPSPCSFSVNKTSASLAAAGGATTVGVTSSASTCKWAASSPVSWITLSGTMTGSSNLTLTVAPNTATTQRSAVVQVAGKSVTISQSGVPCTYTLSATSFSVAKTSGQGVINVKASGSSCAWLVKSNASWLTVSSTSKVGSDEFAFNYTANPTTTIRTGTLTVAGQTVTIKQARR